MSSRNANSMPKVHRKTHKTKRSSRAKTEATRSRKNKVSLQKAVPDTFQTWIESQTRRKQPPREGGEPKATSMPIDTMEAWLGKQQAVEKKKIEDVRLSPGSVEEWLRNQVSERLVKESEAKSGNDSISGTEEVQVLAAPESEPTTPTSENPEPQVQ